MPSAITRVLLAASLISVALAGLASGFTPVAVHADSGGAVTCFTGSGQSKTVELTQTMAPNSSGQLTATPANNSITSPTTTTCELTGTIPQGWSVTDAPFPFILDDGAENDGTLNLTAFSESGNFSSSVTGQGTFTNTGTFEITADPQGPATVSARIPIFDNTATGTVSVTGSSEVDFLDPSSSASATIDNLGAFNVAASSTMTFSGQGGTSCTTGTVFTQDTGGQISNIGTFKVLCGGLSVDGGTLTGANGLVLNPETPGLTLNFGSSVPTGTNAAADQISANGTGVLMSGTIPAGYTVNLAQSLTLNLGPTAGNAGTLALGVNSLLSGTTSSFTNSGSVTAASGAQIDVRSVTNAVSGTISPGSGGSIQFTYDNATAAGTIDNFGAVDSPTSTSVIIGPRCTTGEHFIQESGSTIDATGDFEMHCGTLDFEGGSVSGGPALMNPNLTATLKFGPNVPAPPASGDDIVNISGTNATLAGTIPAGWTVNVPSTTLNAQDSAGNAGTVVLKSDSEISDPGTFTNSGTVDTIGHNGLGYLQVNNFTNRSTGIVTGAASTTTTFEFPAASQSTEGKVENFGTISVPDTATFQVGDGSCPSNGRWDGLDFVSEPGSTIDNSGSFNFVCGVDDVQGGTVTAAGPVTLTPDNISLTFGPTVTGVGGSADTIDVNGSKATLQDIIPKGWTVRLLNGNLNAADGSGNAGQMDWVGSFIGIGDPGTFTNWGSIDLATTAQGDTLSAGNAVNYGSISVADSASLDFAGPSNTTTFLNEGKLQFTTQTSNRVFGHFIQKGQGVTTVVVDSTASQPVLYDENNNYDIDLGGRINLITQPGFNPSAGSTYDIAKLFGSATLSANPSAITGLDAGGGLGYNVTTPSGKLSATVVSLSTFPFVTGLTPNTGPAGSSVSISGTGLSGATGVSFGGTAATNVNSVNGSKVTATAPAGSGSVPVTVTNGAGTSMTIGAPLFTYGPTTSGGAGSATLAVTVHDSNGNPLANTPVDAADAGTGNPLGTATTNGQGVATITGLTAGASVAVIVAAAPAPFSPVTQDVNLAGGSNSTTVTLSAQPLVTSDPTAVISTGAVNAYWPARLPVPGTALDPSTGLAAQGGPLARVDFELQFSSGDAFKLAGDPAGSSGFCTSGDWTLTLVGPAPSTSTHTLTGSGCPAGSPVDVVAGLNTAGTPLSAGIYGGDFTLSVPQGAASYGATPIYLLPTAGDLSNIHDVTTGTLRPADLVGNLQLNVGSSGTLDVTVSGFPLPGISGMHGLLSYDPAGLSLTSGGFPSGWNGFVQPRVGGNGGFVGSTPTRFFDLGDNALFLNFTCTRPGTWPISFSGNYWLPLSSAGYADDLEGSATVTCVAPPAQSKTLPSGVAIDPTTGKLSVTVTGSGLANAAKAELLDASNNVAASTTSVNAAGTVATASFGQTAPGLYTLKLLASGGSTVTTTSGWLAVNPALPLFDVSPIDALGNVPGIATTHLWSVANKGSADGTAILLFTFAPDLTAEPAFDTAAAPSGSFVLSHGQNVNGSYYEYVVVPVAAGDQADIGWTYTIPACSVFHCQAKSRQADGVITSLAAGDVVPVVTSLAGEFNDPEWNSVSNSSPSAILDAGIANGMSDWTSATRAIALLPLSDQSTYLSSISPDLSNGINSLAQDFADGAAATFMTVHKDLPAATPPAPGTGQPAPPSSGGPNGQSFASALSNFNYGSGQAADDGWGDASLNTIAGDSANGVSAKSYAIGSDASLHLGSSLSFGGGQMTTVVQEVAPGSSENATGAYDAVWNDSVAGSSLTQALSNVKGATFHTSSGAEGIAGLPFLQNSSAGTLFTANVALTPSGASSSFAQAAGHVRHDDPANPNSDDFTTITSIGGVPHGSVNSSNTGSGAMRLALLKVADIIVNVVKDVYNPEPSVKDVPGIIKKIRDGNPIVTSEDPNDITATPAGAGKAGWTVPGPITYRVGFFNKPTASAKAFNIVVKLPLSANLDASTIQPGPSSFAGTQFAFDPLSRIVTWTLPNVDLPPDTAPPNGEAWVSFTINPKAGLTNASAINEQASVFFDYNPPITTTPVISTIDTVAPTTTFHALPKTHKSGKVKLSWKATTPVGVATYQLFQSLDGGKLRFLETVTKSSATVKLKSHKTYGFAVTATDLAGLAAKPPTKLQVKTKVS